MDYIRKYVFLLASKCLGLVFSKFRFLMPCLGYKPEDIASVFSFHTKYSYFRSLQSCAKETGLSQFRCAVIKEFLYRTNRLGLYVFRKKQPPHKFMRLEIEKRFNISRNSHILEIGFGRNPIFPWGEYPNWFGLDKFWDNGAVDFHNQNWKLDHWPEGRIASGAWEDISESQFGGILRGNCDLVVGSHSFEHCNQPIKSLKEAGKMLKAGGGLALFVPDPYSEDHNTKDPTHTLYLVPEMIEELFEYAGGYTKVSVSPFRPNADILITAYKR